MLGPGGVCGPLLALGLAPVQLLGNLDPAASVVAHLVLVDQAGGGELEQGVEGS